MLINCLPRRKIMCGVKPPRCAIQRRTGDGYIEYSIWVASGLVIARPLAPKSHAAWNPRLACDVTQILSWGTAPRKMAQALIFVDVSANPPAAVLGYPDHGVTRPHTRQQENRGEQPRHKFHIQPQSKPVEPECARLE